VAFGYYSKPPMIGWVIRFFTELFDDSAFWIRFPAPLFHGVTALILGAIAARLFDARAAILVALAYVTLPMVAVGSLLVSTDTIMFPFLAAALLGYLTLLDSPSTRIAILTGIALGLAFLSKYAALYFVIGAVIALPIARPSVKTALTVLAAFLVTASPNLIWNLANGLTTVQHTLDNADWVRDPAARAGLNWANLSEFFGAQFAVFGPILFGGLLFRAIRWKANPSIIRILLAFVLPIIAFVCIQALLSKAYANWAAAAYLAGILVVIPWLTRPWLIASFVINGFLCLLFPIATTIPTYLARDGQPLLNRYVMRHAMTDTILATADAQNLKTIVASDRDILADLFYHGRDHGADYRAIPPMNRAPHHYALRFPYQTQTDDILLVLRASETPPCSATELSKIKPGIGASRLHPMTLYQASGDCF